MTRKDYVAMAKVLSESPAPTGIIEDIAKGVADVFAADNPAFDRDRFYAACNVDPS